MIMTRKFTALLLLAAVLGGVMPAPAVNRFAQNPADLNLMEAVFVNPALNPLLRDKVSIAGTFYHPALNERFTSLYDGMVSYNFPWKLRGLAVGVQYLSAEPYYETHVRGSYGRELLPGLTGGVNLDAFMLDYDQLQFSEDFDFADPIIAENDFKIGASIGLGLFYRPRPDLHFGLALENLNRPELSVETGGYRDPVLINLGASYQYDSAWAFRAAFVGLPGTSFGAGGDVSALRDLADHFELGVGRALGNGATVRVTGGSRALWAELGFHMIGNWYFDYRYDYPLTSIVDASSGTHRFGVVYDVYRRPPLPEPGELPALPVHDASGVEWPVPDPRGQIYVYTPRDELAVWHEHSLATLDTTLGAVQRTNLRPRDFGDVRAIDIREDIPEFPGRPAVQNRPPKGMYTPEYLGALETISYYLKQEQADAELLSPQLSATRARGLKNVVTGGGYQVRRGFPVRTQFTSERSIEKIDSLIQSEQTRIEDRLVGAATFYIVKAFTDGFSDPWRFDIRDIGRDRVIFQIGSPEPMPDEIVWSGRQPDGTVLPAGIYEYTFSYQRPDGERELGGHGRMKVVHHQVYRRIEIKDRLEGGEREATDFELILNPERRRRLSSQQTDE
ncbi:MAG: hypothetical protein MAG453_02130 [Calditrichaeota bacterium]|nr:hypothetical protein [Calditrichota bacterium]